MPGNNNTLDKAVNLRQLKMAYDDLQSDIAALNPASAASTATCESIIDELT